MYILVKTHENVKVIQKVGSITSKSADYKNRREVGYPAHCFKLRRAINLNSFPLVRPEILSLNSVVIMNPTISFLHEGFDSLAMFGMLNE